jgi:IS30 family transposase
MAINNSKFAIEERQRQVASMLARSMTETEIAKQLNVSQGTISNDIKVLKEKSQQFVFDLAKSDLAFFYKQEYDDLGEVKAKAWDICNAPDTPTKERLHALKVIIMTAEARSKLLQEGPAVLTMKSLDDRVTEVINNNNGRTQTN